MTKKQITLAALHERVTALENEREALLQELADVKAGQRILAQFIHELRTGKGEMTPEFIRTVVGTKQ